MSILNDKSIRELMTKGKLIVDGHPRRIAQSAYQFVAGRIFPAGHAGEPLNWTGEVAPTEEFLVPPGGLVWIRTRESVRMPNDLCGFWFQTNSLARDGLMLVNLSIVDPGYEGPLACNFVNFGKHPIVITPNTPLAKMIFVRLESSVETPFRGNVEKYDENLRKHALQAPESFLQVTEMVAKLSKEREDAIAAIHEIRESAKQKMTEEQGLQQQQLKIALDGHVSSLKDQLKAQREAEWSALNADLTKYIQKWLGWGALIILTITFLWSLVPKLQDWIVGDTINNRINAAVEREVARRAVLLLEQNGQGKLPPTAAVTSTPTGVPAATSAAPDAGTPSTPDAGTPSTSDAGTPTRPGP